MVDKCSAVNQESQALDATIYRTTHAVCQGGDARLPVRVARSKRYGAIKRTSFSHRQGRIQSADTAQMFLHYITWLYHPSFRRVWEPHQRTGGVKAVYDEAETPPGAQRGRHDHPGRQPSDS